MILLKDEPDRFLCEEVRDREFKWMGWFLKSEASFEDPTIEDL